MGGEMTKDDIFELARKAGMVRLLDEHAHEYGNGMFENTEYPQLEKFAALVAAKERAACAQVCEDLIGTRAMARHCADAIRARGQA